MFSIIIPVYNKAPYVKKAIQSVLNQTFKEFELIVIDDGSTDNSLKVIQQLNDHTIPKFYVISQVNSGVAITRNNGVKVAKFDYIAFLDADDWWDEHFLDEMKNLIEEFPEAGIYGAKYYWVKNGINRESINHESAQFKGYINYFKAYTYAWYMPLSSISVVLPKQIFNNENGFNPNLKFGEDFELWIRIAIKHKVAYLNKPLAYYNQDVANENRALGPKKLWKKEEHVIFNLDYLKPYELVNPDLQILLNGLRVRSLIDYYLNNKYSNDVKLIISKIDLLNQPRYYRFIFTWPKSVVKLYFLSINYGSITKQYLIRKHLIKSC